MDSVYFNRIQTSIPLVSYKMELGGSGQITTNFEYEYILLKLYPNPSANVFTELLFIILTIYYAKRVLNLFKICWKNSKISDEMRGRSDLKDMDFFSRMINFPFNKVTGVIHLIKLLIKRLAEFLLILLYTLVYFFKHYTLYIFQVSLNLLRRFP